MKKKTPPPLPPRPFTRREALQVGATAAAGLAVLGGAWWLRRRYDEKD